MGLGVRAGRRIKHFFSSSERRPSYKEKRMGFGVGFKFMLYPPGETHGLLETSFLLLNHDRVTTQQTVMRTP